MLKALGSRLTYANVMATVAVFLALGGGAYALSGIPDRGGIFHGCASNRTGALRVVKSASSCQKASGRGARRNPGESAISWNQQGRPGLQGGQGLQGVQGGQGGQGQPGGAGQPGPSDVFAVGVADQAFPSGSALTEVATMTVPAGSYLLGASVGLSKTAMGATHFDCSLSDGTSGTVTTWDVKSIDLTDTTPSAELSLGGVDTFSAPKSVKVVCDSVSEAVNAANTRLWAIKTGNLHATLPFPLD